MRHSTPTDTTAFQCSYLMFHWVTGIPFGSELHGGAYDDLTLWEQIDGGAQNTPSKKWLFSVPVGLCVFLLPRFSLMLTRPQTQNSFLLSTHYTNYNPWLFAINLSALIFVLVPKLPMVRSVLYECILSMTTDAADSDRLIASAYVSSRVSHPAMLHRLHQRIIHRVLVRPQITCVHCPRST